MNESPKFIILNCVTVINEKKSCQSSLFRLRELQTISGKTGLPEKFKQMKMISRQQPGLLTFLL